MKYCFDTSALIDLGERHYPKHLKVFAPIWDYLYRGIKDGEILSVDCVEIELEKKADKWRKDFLNHARPMFQISESVEREYADVIREIETRSEFRVNKHWERFIGGADPWVIALARNIGECTVVSAETKTLTDYGLKPVCQILGVKHNNLVEFFEANKIG